MLSPGPEKHLHRDQTGQTTIEWALLLGAFGIPMIYVMVLLLGALCEHYRMVTFIEKLPLP
ncbi:MAG: Flp family type IVb pilin [Phycisphaerae bacterium]